MKKAIFIISIITLFFVGCKKDDIAEASKVRIETETIEKGWDYIKINVEYDYPVALEAVSLYLSEKEDMSNANVYECSLEGKKYSVELDSLKTGAAYYYCYEYDNGYEKEKGGKKSMQTISKPVVVTDAATNVTPTTAVLKGSVTNNDSGNKITEMGLCWGTEHEPAIEGEHYNKGIGNAEGTTTFTYNLVNLQDNVTYYFRSYVVTSLGIVYGEEKSFTTVEIVLPTVKTNAVTNIKATTATCGGYVSSDGNGTVTARGVCWSTSQNPTINDNKTTEGSGIGSYSSNLSNLSDNTTYYIRAYATNEKGTAYGEEMSFATLKKVLPTVTTNAVTNIKATTATCGGYVSSDGNGTVTARGICWSTKPNPTISDSKTTDGSGTGSFTSYMSGLQDGTTYYVRAYATNEKGTAYGEEKSFATLKKVLPTVTTNAVTNIKATTATCGGYVSSDGNATVTARGICWSTNPNPTISDSKTTDGSGTGSFTSYMSGLQDGTTYYVRAYATNEKGTAYGEEKSFATLKKVLPTVTTNAVTNIKATTATCGGYVSSDGNATVTARGICWSTSPNPTISDSKTTDGSGTGSYTSYLSNLASQTTYYVRAYATNEKGTAYGEEKSFRTRALTGTENGYGWVDLGLSVKWATCNVGATSPEEYGAYFAWGETTTKSNYSNSNCPTYGLSISQLQSQGYIDSEGNLNPQYDAARANWGGSWRMPTESEMQELRDKCTWTWTTYNGVKGYNVKGPNGNSIFLPAAGYRYGSSLDSAGSRGSYWSSSPYEGYDGFYAYTLYFVSDGRIMSNGYLRDYGRSVRPVVE